MAALVTQWRGWWALPTTPPDATQRQVAALGAARRFTWLDGVMLGTIALSLSLDVIAAIMAAGWWTSAVISLLMVSVLAGIASLVPVVRPLLLRLMVIGFVGGVCELFTDAAGEALHSLAYPANEPMLWASPLYMPLAWTVVLTQLGYLGWRFRARFAPGWAALFTGLCGAFHIPFAEEMAYHAGWWRYQPIHTLGHTPLYVVLFEGLIAAALPLLLARVEGRTLGQVVVLGGIVGLWMPWAALCAWGLLGH